MILTFYVHRSSFLGSYKKNQTKYIKSISSLVLNFYTQTARNYTESQELSVLAGVLTLSVIDGTLSLFKFNSDYTWAHPSDNQAPRMSRAWLSLFRLLGVHPITVSFSLCNPLLPPRFSLWQATSNPEWNLLDRR